MRKIDQLIEDQKAHGWNINARRAALKQRQKDSLNAFKERVKERQDAIKKAEDARKEREDKRKEAEQERKARVAERDRIKQEVKRELQHQKNGDGD